MSTDLYASYTHLQAVTETVWLHNSDGLLFGLYHSHSLSLCCCGLPVLSGNTERGMPHVQWSVTVLHHYYWTQHYSSRSNVIVRLSDPGPVSAASAGPQLAVRTKTRNSAGQGSPCIFAHQQNMLSPCTQKYMSKNICQKKISKNCLRFLWKYICVK